MAKKGVQQSFQQELNTDEELFKYIDRKGLVVIDVYTDWCGPCIGMLNNLKKIKLEIGGDNLHLAIAKSDTIEVLARFRNRSEPTWLFLINGRATNILFGANVPKLTQIITKELEMSAKTRVDRKTYAIDELQPMEVEILEAKRRKEEENARIEREAEENKRKTYLNFCTNSIMENLPENGIIMFGPHITRDGLKRIIEIAEKERIQPKDRKLVVLEQSQMETLNYANNNPIDPSVLEQMYGKELIVVLWKLADGETRPIEEALIALRDAICKPYPDENNAEIMLPPLFPAMEIKILIQQEAELQPSERKASIVKDTIETHSSTDKPDEADDEADLETKNDENDNEEDAEEKEEKIDEGEQKESKEGEENENEDNKESEEEQVVEATTNKNESEQEVQAKEISITALKTILIPSAWTPPNKRTNASGIYVFFRHQTLSFLPPDPVPDPPHVIVIYDSYKKREIRDLISKWEMDVMSYGFFTCQNPDEAKLIANSTKNYDANPNKAPSDKIVIKISKKTSHCLLAFAKANPSYVSENCVVGEEEAKKFFPKNYKTGEQQEADELAASKEPPVSKRKQSKKKEDAEEEVNQEE